MLKRSVFSFSSGMMLMECLFAIAISGILFLCISRAYPQIMNTLFYSYQQYQLDVFLRERLLVLETQLRRTGYCYGDCVNGLKSNQLQVSPLKLGQYPHQEKIPALFLLTTSTVMVDGSHLRQKRVIILGIALKRVN